MKVSADQSRYGPWGPFWATAWANVQDKGAVIGIFVILKMCSLKWKRFIQVPFQLNSTKFWGPLRLLYRIKVLPDTFTVLLSPSGHFHWNVSMCLYSWIYAFCPSSPPFCPHLCWMWPAAIPFLDSWFPTFGSFSAQRISWTPELFVYVHSLST